MPSPTRLQNSLQCTSDRTDPAYPCDLSLLPTLTGNPTPDALVHRHQHAHATFIGTRRYLIDLGTPIDLGTIETTNRRLVQYCSCLRADPPCVTYCSINSLNRPANETFLGRTCSFLRYRQPRNLFQRLVRKILRLLARCDPVIHSSLDSHQILNEKQHQILNEKKTELK